MSSKRAPDAADDRDFAALVAACGASFRQGTAVMPEPADWQRFLRLASYHRVEAQALRGLRNAGIALPAGIEDVLQERSRQIAAANLRIIGECARLRRAFDDAGLAILFVKGATLAELAYGDPARKSAADIDILVDRAQFGAAARLLTDLGYRPIEPAKEEVLERWHNLRKESMWIDPERQFAVDLHTRLADSTAFLPDPWTNGGTREVAVAPGVSLPTLGPDALAAYLAVHGATSAWFRLKWLADFAALIEREHRGGISRLRKALAGLGAGSAGDQALHLADRLFGSLDGDLEVRNLVAGRWRIRAATAIALSYLRDAREPTERTGGTLGIHASGLLVTDGIGPLLGQLARKSRMLVSRAV